MFDYMEYQKRLILNKEFAKLDKVLKKLPDFEFEILLEVKSPIIPFSTSFAPSGNH